jgi:hypothetical protein
MNSLSGGIRDTVKLEILRVIEQVWVVTFAFKISSILYLEPGEFFHDYVSSW